MNDSSKRMLIYVLALQPLFIIALLSYYIYGYKQLGDPLKYRQDKKAMMQALQDSLLAQQTVLSPESMGDSTMVGLEMHTSLFEETNRSGEKIDEVVSAIDSLHREKSELEALSNEIKQQQAVLDDLKKRALDEKIVNLSKIYDNMRPQQSTPLFIEMSDTLAVMILSNMQGRNASRVLGAIAETDIGKATRLTRLLALMGVVKLD